MTVVLFSSELNISHHCANETKKGKNGAHKRYFSLKKPRRIEYSSQVKHIKHAILYHVKQKILLS